MRDEDVTFTIEDVGTSANALKQGGSAVDIDENEGRASAGPAGCAEVAALELGDVDWRVG